MEDFRGRQVCQLAVKVDRDLQARCSLLISETHEILPKSSTELAPHPLNFTIGCVIGSIPEWPGPLSIPKWLPDVIVVMTFQKGAVQDGYNDQSEVRQ